MVLALLVPLFPRPLASTLLANPKVAAVERASLLIGGELGGLLVGFGEPEGAEQG